MIISKRNMEALRYFNMSREDVDGPSQYAT
jgi:hypothetical protein